MKILLILIALHLFVIGAFYVLKPSKQATPISAKP